MHDFDWPVERIKPIPEWPVERILLSHEGPAESTQLFLVGLCMEQSQSLWAIGKKMPFPDGLVKIYWQ